MNVTEYRILLYPGQMGSGLRGFEGRSGKCFLSADMYKPACPFVFLVFVGGCHHSLIQE